MQPRTIEMLDHAGCRSVPGVGPQSNLGNFAAFCSTTRCCPADSRMPSTSCRPRRTDTRGHRCRAWRVSAVVHRSHGCARRRRRCRCRCRSSGSAGTENLSGSYLIGCDGGRSIVRKLMGVGFLGPTPRWRHSSETSNWTNHRSGQCSRAPRARHNHRSAIPPAGGGSAERRERATGADGQHARRTSCIDVKGGRH